MTSIFEGQPVKTSPFPSKTRLDSRFLRCLTENLHFLFFFQVSFCSPSKRMILDVKVTSNPVMMTRQPPLSSMSLP